MNEHPPKARVLGPGVVLGMGLGGFLDGIVFHQILQMHGMLSARVSNLHLVGAKVNMFWDGVFHLVMWLMTVAGVALLWRAGARAKGRWCGATCAGALLLGWGAFNLVEGAVNHHFLELHHVYEVAGLSGWDYAFLGSGALLVIAGMLLIRNGSRSPQGKLDSKHD